MFDPFGRKEDEDKARREGRLPPGQSLTNRFPVLHYGPVPSTNLETWTFRIWGEIGRKEDEDKARREGRLPPGQSLTNRCPVLHYGPVPSTNLETWTFRIWGEVEKPAELTWREFNSLPRTTLTMDIHCVTRWSKVDTTWEGVTVRTLIDEGIFKPLPTAKFVLQHAEYGLDRKSTRL